VLSVGSGGTVPTSAPFGEGYGVSGTLDSADLSFTGFHRDVAADQWPSPTRQLAVVTGRSTSPDPAGLPAVDPTDPQSWNRYDHVLNHPLVNVDPLGLDDDCGGPCSGFSCQEDGCIVIVSYYVDDIGYDEPLISTYCPAGGPVAVSSGGGGRGEKTQQKAPKNPCANATLSAAGVNVQQQIATAQGFITAGKIGANATPYANPILSFFGGMYGYYNAVKTGGPNDIKNLPGHSGQSPIDVDAGNISFGITCPYGAGFCQFAAGLAQTLGGHPNFNGTLGTGFDTPSDNVDIRVGQAMRAAGCHE